MGQMLHTPGTKRKGFMHFSPVPAAPLANVSERDMPASLKSIETTVDSVHHGRDAPFGGCEGRLEHPSGAIQHLRNYRKGRRRGLQKSATQVYALFALANFYMAHKEPAPVAGKVTPYSVPRQ